MNLPVLLIHCSKPYNNNIKTPLAAHLSVQKIHILTKKSTSMHSVFKFILICIAEQIR